MTEIHRHRLLVALTFRARQKRKGVLREAWPEFRPKHGKRRRRQEHPRNRVERQMKSRRRKLEQELRVAIAKTEWPESMRGNPERLVQGTLWWFDQVSTYSNPSITKIVDHEVRLAKRERCFNPIPF